MTQPFAHRTRRSHAKTLPSLSCVTAHPPDLGRALGQGTELRLDGISHELQGELGDRPHRDLLAATDVEDLALDALDRARPDEAVHEGLDVVELPRLVPLGHGEPIVAQGLDDDLGDDAVGALAGAVGVERTDDDDGQASALVEHPAETLSGILADGVRRQRVDDRVFAEWCLYVTVDL